MVDTVTIVVAHISRERGQSLLNVDQCFSLKAGADFLQRINEPRHFVGRNPAVQSKPIEPRHAAFGQPSTLQWPIGAAPSDFVVGRMVRWRANPPPVHRRRDRLAETGKLPGFRRLAALVREIVDRQIIRLVALQSLIKFVARQILSELATLAR